MDHSKKRIVLCSGKDDCCPELTFDRNEVVIKDDFGGKVKLSAKEFEILKVKIINQEL